MPKCSAIFSCGHGSKEKCGFPYTSTMSTGSVAAIRIKVVGRGWRRSNLSPRSKYSTKLKARPVYTTVSPIRSASRDPLFLLLVYFLILPSSSLPPPTHGAAAARRRGGTETAGPPPPLFLLGQHKFYEKITHKRCLISGYTHFLDCAHLSMEQHSKESHCRARK